MNGPIKPVKTPSHFSGLQRQIFDSTLELFSYGVTAMEVKQIVDEALAWKRYLAEKAVYEVRQAEKE